MAFLSNQLESSGNYRCEVSAEGTYHVFFFSEMQAYADLEILTFEHRIC